MPAARASRPRRGGVLTAALALGAVIASAAPGSALADVRVGDARVVVSTAGASAVIEREPFRISFRDGAGRTVLAEVAPGASGEPASQVEPPTLDPEPLGGDALPETALYRPLNFTVGADVEQQWPGVPATPWLGNLLAGVRAGVRHSAVRVLGVRATARGGARLEVETTDPGRRLIVVVEPDRGAAIRVSARVSPGDQVVSLGDAFASSPGEAFHGFGGRHNALDQRGNDLYSWIEQENVGAGPFKPVESLPGAGGDRYLFPNGRAAAYYVQPLFVSSRPYGFWLDRTELARFRMASDRPDAWHVGLASSRLRYVVAPGPAPRAIRTLTTITGRHRVPPEWALGPMFDRLSSPFTETAASYEQKVREDLARFDRYGVPVTAYRIEGWALLSPEVLKEIIDELHRRDIRALLYFRAFVAADAANTEPPQDFVDAVRGGYVARTPAGAPYLYQSSFLAGVAALVDFTNPDAIDWWERRIRAALDLGADGFMQDFGEQVFLDMVFADGQTGATMHNRYPVLFHRATRRVIERWRAEHPGRDVWFFTRAGYTGRPGSAAYENANFPGDETTDWSRSSGLASVTTDMLNRGIGGATGFGMDIGGYWDFHTGDTSKELFIRWTQAAALTPVWRLHGSANAGTHAPWTYDAETVALYNRFAALHERARPLILRLWREAARTGMPIARPLWLAYPGDERAAAQDQEWLLGPDVLVAPVVEQGATSRRVYFPEGCWRDAERGTRYGGPAEVDVAAPLDTLPYFVRCGTDPF